MSLFYPINVACPSCGEPVRFMASASVNADRRPDFREQILDGQFQREICGHCKTSFRLEPELNYLDIGRNQWIAVFPVKKLASWPELEALALATFAEAYGEGASDPAREIGVDLKPRLVFGWAALREKIAAADAGLDDVTLELLKIALLRGMEDAPLAAGTELRFVEAEGDELVIVWIASATEILVESLRVPRALYDEIAADQTGWAPLREEISAGYFVDALRLMAATAA
jgi:hypothetical protein